MAVAESTVRADPRSDDQTDRRPVPWLIMSAALIGFSWWIAAPIWLVAGQSAPIIDQLIDENGGPLTAMEWYEHVEAEQIFCLHPEGLEPANRFGRFIDGGVLYGPVLVLKILVSLAALLIAGATAVVLSRRWSTVLLLVIGASALALLAPLAIYADTIDAVTNIVE